MNSTVVRPQQEVPPSQDAFTPPKPDYGHDRDAAYIFAQLNNLSKDIGQLTASIQTNTQTLSELRTDLKKSCDDVSGLDKKLSSHISFAKGAGAVVLLVCGLLAWAWGSIIKPGLAHAIVEQVKPELTKQVADAVKAAEIPKAPSNAKGK